MKVTFVDLETTGLDPQKHEIIEMAAILTEVSPDSVKVLNTVHHRVYPHLPVDPFVASLNHFNEAVWEIEAEELPVALADVFTLMRGSVFAGSNPKFDEGFLKVAADTFHWSYPQLATYHLIDVPALAINLLVQGKVNKLKQETLAEYYGIPGGGHHAFEDAMQCAKLFAVILGLNFVES